MRRSLTTVEPSVLDFSNFSGGLNLLTAPENIEQNELAECVNMTYSSQPGKLRTRSGIGEPLAEYDTRVMGMTWYKDQLIVATRDKKLYRVPVDGSTATPYIGEVTGAGTWRPAFCEYGGELFIASHGKLQKYDGTTLATITDAPNADVVYARAGRVFCSYYGSDTLRGSAVGDPLTWTVPASPTDADPVETQIGYKVAGNIVAIIPAITDVIIFKDYGIFRLIGEYPDWTIKEVTRDERICNHHCAVNVAGFVYYLEKSKGVRLLQGTQGYEEIAPGDVLQKVNPWIRARLDENYGGLWHLPAHNLIVVNPNDNTGSEIMPCYYEFGLDSMPALKWKFHDTVQAIVERDRDHLYIAVGNAVYDFSGVSAYDPDETGKLHLVESELSTKRYIGFNHYLVKRMSLHANAYIKDIVTDEELGIYVNETLYQRVSFYSDESIYVYGNTELVLDNPNELTSHFSEYVDFAKHNLLRAKAVQLHLKNKGTPFELTRLSFEMIPVGVIA